MIKLSCVVACLFVWCGAGQACAQTAQESVERTIGSLVLQNANCSSQSMAAQEELRKVKAELDALKAKHEPAK